MKKKFMMVTLLLGTLMLGACVDDNETASVSAVREATAKQLKSVAAMNRAEAEATKALADAEVALMQAKAAAEKANAEYSRAQLEIKQKTLEWYELQKEAQTIENQREQVRLETALADLEKTKKQAEADLARIAAEMEAAEVQTQANLLIYQRWLMQAQETLLDYQEQLEKAKTDAEKELIEAERTKVQALADFYSGAVRDWLNQKQELNTLNSDLILYENSLITANQLKERRIISNNNTIALYKVYIERLKEYENYAEDFTALSNAYAEASAKMSKVENDYMAAQTVYNAVRPNLTVSGEMTSALKNNLMYQFYYYGYYTGRYSTLDSETGENVRHSVDYVLLDFMRNKDLKIDYGYEDRTYDFEGENIAQTTDPSVENMGSDFVLGYPEMPADLRSFELTVNDRIAVIEGWIDGDKETLKEKQRLYNGEVTLGDYGVEVVDDQGNRVPSTVKCKNAVDSTLAVKAQYDAESDAEKKEILRQRYNDALSREEGLANNIASYESSIERNTNYLADFKLQWDMIQNFETYKAELQKEVDARNAQEEEEYAEKLTAWTEMMKVKDIYEALKPEVDALTLQVLMWYNNGQETANSINRQIKDYQDQIERMEKENAQTWVDGYDDSGNWFYLDIVLQEELIEAQKASIVAQEARVKAYEIVVANAKAALEAAMPKGEEE